MKFRYFAFCLMAGAMTVSSCNAFLDINPTDKATEKLVWSDAANAEMEAAFNDPNMSSDELISLFKKNMKRIDAAAAL